MRRHRTVRQVAARAQIATLRGAGEHPRLPLRLIPHSSWCLKLVEHLFRVLADQQTPRGALHSLAEMKPCTAADSPGQEGRPEPVRVGSVGGG